MKKWLGGKQCDICREGVKLQGPEFYDAQVRVKNRVTWAVVCYECRGFICGIGQVYDSETAAKIDDLANRRKPK